MRFGFVVTNLFWMIDKFMELLINYNAVCIFHHQLNFVQIGNHGPEEGIELQSGWSSVRSVTEGGQEREGDNKPEMDENGNPTTYTNGSSNGPFPIMDPQLRPLSIYR